MCFEWFKRFKEGKTSTEDDQRQGWSSTSKTQENVTCVGHMVRANLRLTVREDEVGLLYGSCSDILTKDPGMSRVAAKFVPRLLSEDQK
jgi:hypothetical protein